MLISGGGIDGVKPGLFRGRDERRLETRGGARGGEKGGTKPFRTGGMGNVETSMFGGWRWASYGVGRGGEVGEKADVLLAGEVPDGEQLDVLY